jgi:hypothetical protein
MTAQISTSKTSGLAIFFFLLGLPNLYSAMQRRRSAPAARPVFSLGLGWLALTLAGTCSLLAF